MALAALFVFTALFRFLVLSSGFPNDHFLHLASAQQLLFGEWPTRDFLDPGLPLMYIASALAQVLLGRTLFAEAVLVALAFALAAVLTAAAVRELTGSRVLALVAAVIEIAIVPRPYGYPKLLLYAAGFFLLQRYVTHPTTGRLFAFAAATVVAFLFRHDHGIYLGIGGVLAAWLAAGPEHRSGGARRAATFVGIIALLTAPYLLYVQAYDGVWSYLQKGLEFRAAELSRQEYVWPALFGEQPHYAALLYEYWVLPIAASSLLLVYRRRDDARSIVARVAPIIAVALLVNATFLRNPLNVRLQDTIVPAVILGSWLTGCAWRSRRRWVWRPVAALLVVLVASSVMEVGGTIEQLDRAGLLVTWTRVPEFLREVSSTLRARRAESQLPSRAAAALLPFYPYVDRCTTRDHRLLVVGNVPEVLIFTQRAFAGGQPAFVGGYYLSETYQRSVLKRMRQEVVPFVLIPGEAYSSEFSVAFPLVADYVRRRYVPLATFGADAATSVQVMFDSTLPIPRRDAETGLPCFR